MSTSIPISADSSQAVAAVEQITAAIRKSGQEGRKFAELDLSHPELEEMAEDIQRMQSNFNTMKSFKNFNGTAKTVNSGNYSDVIDWMQNHGKQFSGDEDARREHFAKAGNYFTYGSRWGASPPGANPPPGGGGNGGGLGFSGLPIPGIGKLLGIGLGIAGIGKVSSMVSDGVSGATEEAVQIDTFKRMIGDTSTEFSDLRQSIREAGEGLQLTYGETIKLAQSFAKASSYTDSLRINEEVKTSAGFARAFGLDPNQVTRSFGESRFLQVGGGSDTGPKEMAIMFADAIAAGNMWSKADEVIDAIIGFTRQSERTMVDAPNVRAYADLSSTMNDSDRPGLQGQAGAALLNAINQAMQHGGGAGTAGQNFMWRALNQNGEMGPFQTRMQQEKGMFGKLPDGRTNFEAVNQFAEKQYANPLQRADALSNLFNTSMTQMMAMMDLKPGSHSKLAEMIKRYGIDPETIDATSYQGLADIATSNDSRLGVIRDDLLKRDDLTDTQKRTVRGAPAGDDLRSVLAKTIAAAGREQTAGMKTLDAVTAMKNALTTVGSPLLAPIYEIKGFLAQMVESPLDTTEGVVQGASQSASGAYIDASDFIRGRKRAKSNTSGGIDFDENGVPQYRTVNPLLKQVDIPEKPETNFANQSYKRDRDFLDFLKDYKRPPGHSGNTSGVPEYANQKEIKLRNEIVVIHKNEKGELLKEEHLPATTIQIRE